LNKYYKYIDSRDLPVDECFHLRSHAPEAGAVSKKNTVALAKHVFSVADMVEWLRRASQMKWTVNQSTPKYDQPVINDGMRSLCGVRRRGCGFWS
jgi:hypothetical protein